MRYLITIEIEADSPEQAADMTAEGIAEDLLPGPTIAVVDADSGREYIVTLPVAENVKSAP